MSDAPYVELRPIAIKDRSSIVFLEYGQVDVIDGAFVLVDPVLAAAVQTRSPQHARLDHRSGADDHRALARAAGEEGREPLAISLPLEHLV